MEASDFRRVRSRRERNIPSTNPGGHSRFTTPLSSTSTRMIAQFSQRSQVCRNKKYFFPICPSFATYPVDFDLRLTYNSHQEAIVFLHFFPQSHPSPASRRNGRSGSDRVGGEKCPVTAFQGERPGSVSVVTGLFRKSPDSVQCGQPYKGVAALLKCNQCGCSVRQALCRTAELNNEFVCCDFFPRTPPLFILPPPNHDIQYSQGITSITFSCLDNFHQKC